MANEKSTIVTDATGPDAGPAPVQPEAGGGTPAPKQEQPAPEAVSPDKATAPEQAATAQPENGADAPKEQKAASVSVFNFSEIMAEKKAAEKAAAKQEAKAPDKGTSPTPTKKDGPKQEKPKEQEQAPKRRGRPPKADKDKAAAPAQKEAPGKKDKAVQKSAQPGKTEKAASSGKAEEAPKTPKPAKGAPEVKAPVHAETPAAPAETPRPAKDEQIVYIKLSELHAFKNHPFQVRNDEEMKAMVSSVRDKGVTQPAIVRPREDGGYENVDFKMEHFDCAPMIHGYLREIDDLVATKELQIHLAIQSPAFINGNKLLIEKVFSNLISNAVKYSPHGASVDIILQNTNGRFLFSVENTGTHIPEDDIPKLFDAFYRMEQSRSRRTGGSGLGLYMVQRILQQHNSYCEACNTENGVKFFFTI